MITLKKIKSKNLKLSSVKLEDLSAFESKIEKIKCLREIKDESNGQKVLETIRKLKFQNKTITAKRVQKVLRQTIEQMIKEA